MKKLETGNFKKTELIEMYFRVLLLRYEDIAADSMKFAKIVYNFTDLAFEDEIKSWIETQLQSSADGSKQNPFSTDKNPTQAGYFKVENSSIL